MIWRQNVQNFWVRSQNYKSNQITMERNDLISKQSKMSSYVVKHSKQRKTTKVIKLRSICIDLTSKRSKMLSYVAKHSKQRKTTKLVKLQWIASIWCQNDQKSQNYKLIKLQWIASIWCQNDQNNAKLQKWSNYN